MQPYIVIAVMILMIIAFVLNKWPFGLITLSCCVILGLAGVLAPAEVFSGFANPFVVMLAGCFAVTSALGKTDFIITLQKRIVGLQKGKSETILMVIFVITIIVLATFMPGPSLIALIIVMASNLQDDGQVNAARVIFPTAALTTIWNGRIPFGLGAGSFAVLNGLLEPYSVDYTVGMFDPMKAALFPGIALAIYTILCYKLLPHKPIDRSAIEDSSTSNKTSKMSKRDQIITYIVFVAMILVMIFNKYTGNLMYIGPALATIILIFLKVITVEETKKAISADLIFMLAGIFTLTGALSSTGAGEIIGTTILSFFGGATTEFGLIALFGGITIIVTNFMSNNASMYSMIPVAITTAIAAGVNPIPVMLTIDVAAKCACFLPCSSGEAAMCYGGSGYTPAQTMKFTIPACIMYYVMLLVGMKILF